MMKSFTFSVFLLISLTGIVLNSYSQTFVGGQIDNYSGVHSVLMNPANIAGSKMKLDINLFSASAFVGSDYLIFDLSDIKSFRDGFDFDTDVITTPNNQNNFFGNIDILGPSFQLNIGENNSIAISTRVRTFFNLHNFGGELYEVTSSGDFSENFSISMENVTGIIHAWGELGGTYGRVLIDEENQRLKVGVTLKYLFGAGGVHGSSDQLDAQFDAQVNSLTTRGILNYGYTSGFDSEDISFSDIQSGFGADFGIVYELLGKQNGSYQSPYKLKLGASVTDIGSINYAGTYKAQYDMDATIDANEFENKDLDEVLNDNYPGTESTEDLKLGLPTAIQLFADYHIRNKFYVSAQGAISMKKGNEIPVSNIINAFTLTPRFEAKWISVYSPFSLRQYDSSIVWGVGLRAGPVMVGSGSILSNLISNNSRSTDLYIGLKVPLYKRDS